MNDFTTEDARTAIAQAIERSADRYVDRLMGGGETVRFADVLAQDIPSMVARVVRTVEASFWKRELIRRQRDNRYDYEDPSIRAPRQTWDATLRQTMRMSGKELKQLVIRALTLQMDSITSPEDAMAVHVFSKQEQVPSKRAVLIADHLGLEEGYVRALMLMAQDDESRPITANDFRRVVRDVNAKEHQNSRDVFAIKALNHALLVLGLRSEEEFGSVPSPLARSFFLLHGTPEGFQKVANASEGSARIEMDEIEALFISEESEPIIFDEGRSEEVSRFLEDFGVDGEFGPAEDTAEETGAVRFILTEEEKQAYVARAVGHNVHLIEPIMRSIEGALTWDEVDRAIFEILPDDERDVPSRTWDFRNRIR